MASSPKKLTTVIYFSPQYWGELDRFVRLYHETYKFDERTLHILHGVAGHFHKANYLVRRYSKAWNEDTKERLKNLMSHVKELQACDICANTFSLEKDVFTYRTFNIKLVDALYPNLFASVSRTFVEYFGLMSNSDYATKTSLKQAIAVESKINLISFFPETSWKDVLLNWKTQLKK
jgi:hypothetical protein